MSDASDEVPQEYYDVVDEFINLANSLGDKWGEERLSSTIMFAASRYNAFYFVSTASKPEKDKAEAIEYFCSQYRAMLLDNIERLIAEERRESKE